MATEKIINAGVAGLGRSGWDIHVRAMRAMPEQFKVVAAVDADPARREEAVANLGCRVSDRFEKLIGDDEVELVVVASPSSLHSEHAIAAMEAGKDVLVEKPFALDSAAADTMIEVSARTGRTLAPFQNMRYQAAFRKIREVIDSGLLGRIVQVRIVSHGFGRRWDWQTLKEFGGGTLNNTGPHFIDLALVLFGEGEPNVFANLQRVLTSGDAEDHAKLILRGEDAPLIDIELTSACAWPQETWLIMGSSGGLKGTPKQLQWRWVDFAQLPPRPVDRTPLAADRAYQKEELPWQTDSWSAEDSSVDSPIRLFYRDLHAALSAKQPLVVTPQHVRRQIAVIEKAHEMSPV